MSARPDHAALTRLDGRGIVLLGAGGGAIGEQTAQLLSAAGARLLCVDVLEAEAERVAAEIGGTPHVADITDRAQMEDVFATADKLFGADFHGIADVVGAGSAATLHEFDDAAIDRIFALNFRHALVATQIAGPMLAARGGGSMVFVGSLAGHVVAPDQAIYGSAKAALHQLVRYGAQEYGPDGVRVNAVAPAIVLTDRLKAKAAPGMLEEIAALTPLRRIAEPLDVAGAILFLLSDLARQVTGSVLNVDGGTMTGANLPRTRARPAVGA